MKSKKRKMWFKTICKKFNIFPKEIKIILYSIIFLLLIDNVVLAYNNLQTQTTILGLTLHGKRLTGLSYSHMKKLIQQEITKNNQPLQLWYRNKTFLVYPREIGTHVDIEEFTNHLIEKGRSGTFFQKLFTQHQALFGLKDEKLEGTISQSLLTLKLLQIQDEINQDATPLTPDFVHDINHTIPAREGIRVDTNKLSILIIDNIFHPPLSLVSMPTLKVFPTQHQENGLEPIRREAVALTKEPLSISSGGQTFTLTPSDLRLLLTIVERPDPQNPKRSTLSLRLDDKTLNRKLGEFAARVESQTFAEFDDHDARVAIYSQFYSKKRHLIAIPTGRSLIKQKVLGIKTQPGPKVAYLTFDDGPNSLYHPLILDILKTYDVKATFFLVGQNSQRDPQITTRTISEGHPIGNHSLTHPFLPNLHATTILKEIQTTDDILKPFNNNQGITLFRPPYGGVNIFVKKDAEDLGLKLILWDVDPRDWSEPSTDELVRRVVSNTMNGSDILFHSNHLATVKALPKIIEILKAEGFTFETLH